MVGSTIAQKARLGAEEITVAESQKLALQYAHRVDQGDWVLDDHRGENFLDAVPGGARSYALQTTIETKRFANRTLVMIGTLLCVSGLLALLLERRFFAAWNAGLQTDSLLLARDDKEPSKREGACACLNGDEDATRRAQKQRRRNAELRFKGANSQLHRRRSHLPVRLMSSQNFLPWFRSEISLFAVRPELDIRARQSEAQATGWLPRASGSGLQSPAQLGPPLRFLTQHSLCQHLF